MSVLKAALDEFFILLGPEACEAIEVVATDQHEDYGASVREYCKKAILVWDKFHLLQNFEIAVNKTRMQLHEEQAKGSDIQRLTRGQSLKNYFRFPVTTGLSEGINRAIKGLKWQAYGYKDMEYFKLKILQKVGYLNYRYCLIANF